MGRRHVQRSSNNSKDRRSDHHGCTSVGSRAGSERLAARAAASRPTQRVQGPTARPHTEAQVHASRCLAHAYRTYSTYAALAPVGHRSFLAAVLSTLCPRRHRYRIDCRGHTMASVGRCRQPHSLLWHPPTPDGANHGYPLPSPPRAPDSGLPEDRARASRCRGSPHAPLMSQYYPGQSRRAYLWLSYDVSPRLRQPDGPNRTVRVVAAAHACDDPLSTPQL